MVKLLAYNPDDRLSARQALRHPYFKELRDAEKRQKALTTPDISNHFNAMETGDSKGQTTARRLVRWGSGLSADCESFRNLRP